MRGLPDVMVAAADVALLGLTVVLGKNAAKLMVTLRRRKPASVSVVRVASAVVRVVPLPALTPLRRSTTPIRALNWKLAFSASVMLATVCVLVRGTEMADSSSGATVGDAVAPTAVGDGVGKAAGRPLVGAVVTGAAVVGANETGASESVGATVVGANETGASVLVGAGVTGANETGASEPVGD